LCDVVYAIRVEALERYVLAAVAAGADVDPDEQRARFDKWLESVPDAVADPERYELMQALGLGR
jgi:hypothetical protein